MLSFAYFVFNCILKKVMYEIQIRKVSIFRTVNCDRVTIYKNIPSIWSPHRKFA